jgi:large subunit ribosomal protein L10
LGRAEKEEKVKVFADKLASYNATLLTDYQGLDADTITELRRKFRESDVEFRIFKNTLAKLAADSASVPELAALIDGPTAYAFSQDPVTSARIVGEFSKTHPQLRIKGGLLEGAVLTGERAGHLATLPDLHTLQTMLATQLTSPLYAFASALGAMLRMLMYVLEEVRKQKGEEPTEQVVESSEEEN